MGFTWINFTDELTYTKLFIYIASAVGFVAVALVLGVTCKKFLDKRKKDEKFRRPYDQPKVQYRAAGTESGDEEEDDEVE